MNGTELEKLDSSEELQLQDGKNRSDSIPSTNQENVSGNVSLADEASSDYIPGCFEGTAVFFNYFVFFLSNIALLSQVLRRQWKWFSAPIEVLKRVYAC